MKKRWLAVQTVWIVVKLLLMGIIIGTIALLPFGAAVASLLIVALTAKGFIPFKVAVVLLFILFAIQGLWVLKWG